MHNGPVWWPAWRGFLLLLGLTAALIALLQYRVVPYYRLCLNLSASMPGTLYLLQLGGSAPERGELVAFHVPPGVRYQAGALFLKYVAAVPGDQVRHDPASRAWLVNGRRYGTVLRRDRRGGVLWPGPAGRVPPGFYVFWTPHPHSHDSRYADVGWIPRERVLGRAVPVF